MSSYKLSFAGAGRVAGAICTAFHGAGHTIVRIVSRSPSEGRRLARECKASWSQDLNFSEPTDILIVAVPDNSLGAVLSAINCNPETLVVHTAGSYGLDIFPDKLRNRGVFYPLQTFSKDRIIDFKELPFLLDASDNQSKHKLENLALSVNGRVHFVDPDRRRKIHLAAVFVCNFANHMFTIGKEIASGAEAPFEWFAPLINETVAKALIKGPYESQTGPAVRNDRNTIRKHMELLSLSPDIQKLYHDVTQSILQHHNIH